MNLWIRQLDKGKTRLFGTQFKALIHTEQIHCIQTLQCIVSNIFQFSNFCVFGFASVFDNLMMLLGGFCRLWGCFCSFAVVVLVLIFNPIVTFLATFQQPD